MNNHTGELQGVSREHQIPLQQARHTTEIQILEEVVVALRERLISVLQVDGLQDKVSSEKLSEREPVVPLAGEIITQRRRVEDVNREIKDILNRIEL